MVLLREALARHLSSIYLTGVLYRPVVQFVDGAGRVLGTMDPDTDSMSSAGSGWVKNAEDKNREAAARALRSFMESFVTEVFLPEVYVDFRCAGLWSWAGSGVRFGLAAYGCLVSACGLD